MNLLDAARELRPPRVLGVALGPRAVGLAVTTTVDVIDHRVLNLHKLTSRTGKEARFRQVLQKLLDRHEPSMLALVPSVESGSDPAFLVSLEAWLRGHAASLGLLVEETTAEAVRRAFVPPGEQPSGRRLAEALAGRFEAVRMLAPSHEPIPGATLVPGLRQNGRRTRTCRELYWRPMFAALGAAALALDAGLAPSTKPQSSPRSQGVPD